MSDLMEPGAVPSAARRGRLKHGNPSGDYAAAPRCGAKARAGHACRQPAMKNGRYRFHGGKSTGARTSEGLARCREVNLVHGARTAEMIGLRSAAARSSRILLILSHVARDVLRAQAESERATSCPAMDARVARLAPVEPQSERTTPCPASRAEDRRQKTDDRRQESAGPSARTLSVLCPLSTVLRLGLG